MSQVCMSPPSLFDRLRKFSKSEQRNAETCTPTKRERRLRSSISVLYSNLFPNLFSICEADAPLGSTIGPKRVEVGQRGFIPSVREFFEHRIVTASSGS